MTREDVLNRIKVIDGRIEKLRQQRAAVQAELAALDLAARIGVIAGVRLKDGSPGTLRQLVGRQAIVETSGGRIVAAVADVAIR